MRKGAHKDKMVTSLQGGHYRQVSVYLSPELRDERERSLCSEYTHQLEWEKARAAALEAELKLMKGERGGAGKTAAVVTDPSVTTAQTTAEVKEDMEDPLMTSPRQQASRNVIKSASSSDLLATGHGTPSAVARQPVTTPTPQPRERLSITDLVSECLRNPSSMANIRSHLKADNLTPKIQRKFHHKATPTHLPAVSNETSPLARERMRAGEPHPPPPPSGRATPRCK